MMFQPTYTTHHLLFLHLRFTLRLFCPAKQFAYVQVATFTHKFGSFVQACFRLGQNELGFIQAKVACKAFCYRWFYLFQYWPFYIALFPLVGQFPHIFGKRSGFSFCRIDERTFMVPVSFFECSSCWPYVVFLAIFRCYGRLVYYVVASASVSIKRASFSAIAWQLLNVGVTLQYLSIVGVDKLLHICHARVANPHVILAKYLGQGVTFSEMFFYQIDEASCYISFDAFAKRWVEPQTFSWSVLPFYLLLFFVTDLFTVPAVLQGFVVVFTYLIKLLFATASICDSLTNHLWYL